MHTPSPSLLPVAVTGLLALTASSAAAFPGVPVGPVGPSGDLAARNGVLAYSAPAARGGDEIIVRDAQGTRPLGVAPQRGGFNLELADAPGTTRGVLVYPRCRTSATSTCRVAVASLATSAERIVPGTQGAYRATMLSDGSIVAARWRTGGATELVRVKRGRVTQLPLERLTYFDDRDRERTVRARDTSIDDLDARGGTIAYVQTVVPPGDATAASLLWVQRPGRQRQFIAEVGTGGSASGLRVYEGIRLERQAIVAFRNGFDEGSAVERWSFAGRRLGGMRVRVGGSETVRAAAYDRQRLYAIVGPYPWGQDACVPDGATDGAPDGCSLFETGPVRFRR